MSRASVGLIMMLTLGACAGSQPASLAPQPSTGAVEVTPTPLGLSVAASPDRRDWPCGTDILGGDDSLTDVTVAYDGPTQCLLPIDMHADGIVACPTRLTYTTLKSGRVTHAHLRYDEVGHLVEIIHRKGTTRYKWEGDTLVSRTNHNRGRSEVSYRYVDSNGFVQLIRESDTGPVTEFVLHFQDGKLVHHRTGGSIVKLTWDANRLTRIDAETGKGTRYERLLYDCTP